MLEVFHEGRSRFQMPIDRLIVIGRQRTGDPEPIAKVRQNDGDRLVLSPRSDSHISREHVRIEPLVEGGFRVTNTSRNCTIGIDTSRVLLPAKTCWIEGFSRLHVHDWVVVIDALDWEGRLLSMGTPEHRSGLADGSLATDPGVMIQADFESSLVATLGSSFDAQQQAYLMRWLRVIADLFRHAGDRARFLRYASLAIRQIFGADDVLTYLDDTAENDQILPTSDHPIPTELLKRVREYGQTILYRVDASGQIPGYQLMVTPLFDRAGRVNGILAASRTARQTGCDPLPPYGELEKHLLELIAGGCSGE
ncbi:hypothetical protein Pla100_00060 [Neorhodopirellula pilleata]|uniref:FHA domain-containing protein n=2 Tax=Neorhodopirellula pilleata TaxID=2714738 RepID=A0A5C6AU15_9BACT|nr:hypothetical protein Pla100_00060 [Neorhodopirellula pilleata]